MMKIHFYDESNKYIGSRDLLPNEDVPINATTVSPNISNGKEAHFIDGKWELSDVYDEPITDLPQEPTLEERVAKVETDTDEIVSVLAEIVGVTV